jgi:hypothetical protein
MCLGLPWVTEKWLFGYSVVFFLKNLKFSDLSEDFFGKNRTVKNAKFFGIIPDLFLFTEFFFRADKGKKIPEFGIFADPEKFQIMEFPGFVSRESPNRDSF